MENYFEVPFFRDLTKVDGWNEVDGKGTKYQVARAIFKLNSSHMPGPSKIGRKFEPTGAPIGVGQEKLREISLSTEKFDEIKTIERSIIESNSMGKILSSLSSSFGDGKIFRAGGKVEVEVMESLKTNFQNDFHITNSTRIIKTITYKFKDTFSSEFSDRVCGAAMYQRCRADLYLLMVDFLNVEYKRSWGGLRKKLCKSPFPPKNCNSIKDHPNIIRIGVPVAELQYWELLPISSVLIKDSEYAQEVEDDSEISVYPPREGLINRPYWYPNSYPTLYQLSNVAFPFKWVNKRSKEFTKEDLMKIELGEAEGTGWWYQNGPGRER